MMSGEQVPTWVSDMRRDAEQLLESRGLPVSPWVSYDDGSALLDFYLEEMLGYPGDSNEVAAGHLVRSAEKLSEVPPDARDTRDKWLAEVIYVQTILVGWRQRGQSGGKRKAATRTALTETIEALVADDPDLPLKGLYRACYDGAKEREGVLFGLREQGR